MNEQIAGKLSEGATSPTLRAKASQKCRSPRPWLRGASGYGLQLSDPLTSVGDLSSAGLFPLDGLDRRLLARLQTAVVKGSAASSGFVPGARRYFPKP